MLACHFNGDDSISEGLTRFLRWVGSSHVLCHHGSGGPALERGLSHLGFLMDPSFCPPQTGSPGERSSWAGHDPSLSHLWVYEEIGELAALGPC